MNGRLPVLGYRQVDRVLRRFGFAPVRQRGSHVFYRHPDGRTHHRPHHTGRDLAPPLLRTILDDSGLSLDEFLQELRG